MYGGKVCFERVTMGWEFVRFLWRRFEGMQEGRCGDATKVKREREGERERGSEREREREWVRKIALERKRSEKTETKREGRDSEYGRKDEFENSPDKIAVSSNYSISHFHHGSEHFSDNPLGLIYSSGKDKWFLYRQYTCMELQEKNK